MSLVQEYCERFLDHALPSMAKEGHEEIPFATILRPVLTGEEGQAGINLMLFKALQQARYKPITMRDVIQVVRGEYNDPLYQDLTIAFATFAQSEHLEHVARKKLSKGQILLFHLQTAEEQVAFQKLLEERLTKEERKLLSKEARQNGHKEWQKYVGDYIRQLTSA